MSIEHIQRLDQVDCIKADVSLNPEPYLKSKFRSQEMHPTMDGFIATL